jgi:hypothetical protein
MHASTSAAGVTAGAALPGREALTLAYSNGCAGLPQSRFDGYPVEKHDPLAKNRDLVAVLRPLSRAVAVCAGVCLLVFVAHSFVVQWEGGVHERVGAKRLTYTATSASGFISTLGVNTHLTYSNTPYANLSQVQSELSYLGLSLIRENVTPSTQEYNELSTLMGAGVRVDMLAANTDLTDFMSEAHNLNVAHPGGVYAVEGLNEVNGWNPSYDGLTGYAATIQFQKDLYTDTKADSALAGVSVYAPTVSGITANSNLGNLSGYADYGNEHIYYGGGQPEWGWSTGDSTWFWTNYMAQSQVDVPGKGTVITETGANTLVGNYGEVGVDQATQAKQILNSLMDGLKYGNPATYIYELMDEGVSSNNDQMNYGLFTTTGTAKVAATAIHNFTSILTSHGALSGTPGSLDYTISGTPTWGGQELLQQGDGTYDIVVWNEPDIWNESNATPITAGNTPITINLANAASVKIYDPMTGTTAVQSLGTTNTVSFNVVDHPVIVEVTPTTTTTGGTTTSPSTGGTTGGTTTGGATTGGTTTTTPATTTADPVSDFNNDGKSDMLLVNTTSHLVNIWDSTGSGFQNTSTSSYAAGWSVLGTGSFTGSGQADIYWYNSSTHQISVWDSAYQASGLSTAPTGWTPFATGDFNGDGKSDIYWYNSSANQVTVWQANSTGFTGTAVSSGLSGFKPIGTGDFNGDGKSDILWYNSTTNQISEQMSTGTGFSTPTSPVGVAAGWTPIGTGSFTGNGTSDIYWYNSTTHQISVWDSAYQSTGLNTAPAGWTPVSVGDYNGDGKADILWYNASTHQETVWTATSTGFTGGAVQSVATGYTPFDAFQTGTYGLHMV